MRHSVITSESALPNRPHAQLEKRFTLREFPLPSLRLTEGGEREDTTMMTIEKAREVISHGNDGPVSAFVLVSRATRLAMTEGEEVCANALWEEMSERGYLSYAAEHEYAR